MSAIHRIWSYLSVRVSSVCFLMCLECCYLSSMWKTADEVTSWYCMHCRNKSSHQKVLYEKRCSPKFHKIHRKTLVQSFFFNKGQRPATVLKKRLWHSCLPVSFEKFLKAPFFTEHLWATACAGSKQHIGNPNFQALRCAGIHFWLSPVPV